MAKPVQGEPTKLSKADFVGFVGSGSGEFPIIQPAQAAPAGSWPGTCLESETRFGHPTTSLYPLIGSRVRTPEGTSKLSQAFEGRATVLLDAEEQKPAEDSVR